MYGLETAQRQYDAQYPENELPAELTCSVCGYEEQTKDTYTVNGEIMCYCCFDDFCEKQYNEHGAEFFERNKNEYVKEWYEALEDNEKMKYMLDAYEAYMKDATTSKQYGCSIDYDCEQIDKKRFVVGHSDWKHYIMRVENVEENGY